MKFRAILSHVLAVLTVAFLCAASLVAQSDSTPPAQAQSPAQSANPADAAASSASPAAQQADQANERTPAPPTITFRQSVRRVIVDVMVRDKDGKPVRGLIASDFSVTEDKQPQNILSFDAYDLETPSISRGPNAPPLPPNVFVNVPAVPEHGPLYVMLLDLVNTEMEDQMTARQQVLKFIRSKPAGTRFAIFVTTDKLRLIQGFTDDKDLLYAALDPYHPKPHVPKVFLLGANYGRGDPYTALDMLTHIGQYLDGIPGRKNLIWVAGRFDVALFPYEEDPVDLQDKIRAEINELAQAQVAVFPVDARGVIVNPEGALTGARPNGGASNMSDPGASNAPDPSSLSNPTGGPISQGMQVAGHGAGSVNRAYATEDAVASATGGRALYSTNDLTDALNQVTEDGGNYYTLTYSPPAHDDNGKCHNIAVKLDKPGYQISYRRSYCRVPVVSTATEEAEQESEHTVPLVSPLQAGDLLQGNMRPGAPMLHDLVFSAHVRTSGGATLATAGQMAQLSEQAAVFRKQRRNKPVKPLAPVKIQTYAIDYRVLDPQLKAQASSGRNATLEFAVAAFDADGRVLNGVVNDAMPETLTPGTGNKDGLYRVRQTLVVPVSAVSIRVGVRDRLSDRMGTIEVPLPLKPEPVAQAATPKR